MDKKIMTLGSILIAILVGVLLEYQRQDDSWELVYEAETSEQAREETVRGYKEPEELIAYMFYQIQNGDLDLALRGCPVQQMAEGFLLRSYIEFTESYEPMEMLPPADRDSTAYVGISKLRLADYYAKWIEKCGSIMGPGHHVKLLDMIEDVPEEPDGMYYQNRTSICEIIGAQKLREMLIYAEIDGEIKELRWTLARHGSRWRVLLFTSLEGYGAEQPDVRDSKAVMDDKHVIDYTCEDVLPVNYIVLNDNSEESPEKLIERFFLYLMREDVLSAASYMELYDPEQPLHTNMEILKSHADAGVQFQSFYYKMIFGKQWRYEWYFRDLAARAKDLVEEVGTEQAVTIDLWSVQALTEPSEEQMVYQVSYFYDNSYTATFTLVNHNGWRIQSIEW